MRRPVALVVPIGVPPRRWKPALTVGFALLAATAAPAEAPGRTEVSIEGDRFLVNGTPTYAGRSWNGNRVEGLLFNSRMVQSLSATPVAPARATEATFRGRGWRPNRGRSSYALRRRWRRAFGRGAGTRTRKPT